MNVEGGTQKLWQEEEKALVMKVRGRREWESDEEGATVRVRREELEKKDGRGQQSVSEFLQSASDLVIQYLRFILSMR